LHRADRASAGQAARTDRDRAGPCPRAEALKTHCRADADRAERKKLRNQSGYA
jgi:hypothetical protein